MDELRKDCWDFALHAFGTAYIFRNRAVKYQKRTSLLKFFGIAVPLAVGATATGYGIHSEFLQLVLVIAAPLITVQLIISTIAVVYKWDEELAYSFESSSENSQISLRYEDLAKYPPSTTGELAKEMEVLKTMQSGRDNQDNKHKFTEKEERMGMRYALRNYKRACVGCGKVPTSMDPAECNICGNF